MILAPRLINEAHKLAKFKVRCVLEVAFFVESLVFPLKLTERSQCYQPGRWSHDLIHITASNAPANVMMHQFLCRALLEMLFTSLPSGNTLLGSLFLMYWYFGKPLLVAILTSETKYLPMSYGLHYWYCFWLCKTLKFWYISTLPFHFILIISRL